MALGLDRAIADALETGGVGGDETFFSSFGTYETNIFVAEEPPTPDDTITVYYRGGGEAIVTIAEEVEIAIRVRRGGDDSYDRASEDAHDIHRYLHQFEGSPRGVAIGQMTALGLPVPIGRDETTNQGGRHVIVLSFTALTRRYAFT